MNSAPAKRNTWQKAAIREALTEYVGFISAQALHARLAESGAKVGVATVYRGLAELAEMGEADSLNNDGEMVYRACADSGHHHHLICRSCGATVEISAAPVEKWAKKTAEQYGYSMPEHVIDIFGLCEKCAA